MLPLIWIILHPWFWIGIATLAVGMVLYLRSYRKLSYPVLAASLYPFWQGLQNGINYTIQGTELTRNAALLLKALPYTFVVLVGIGLVFWLWYSNKREYQLD